MSFARINGEGKGLEVTSSGSLPVLSPSTLYRSALLTKEGWGGEVTVTVQPCLLFPSLVYVVTVWVK